MPAGTAEQVSSGTRRVHIEVASVLRKPQPNQAQYLAALHAMTPEAKLRKALELTEMTRQLFRSKLRSTDKCRCPPDAEKTFD